MFDGFGILAATAASIGFFHTILGPDHYLPFIVLAKARAWSITKTALITFLCGLGHVLSSVILGMIGVLVGIGVFKLENVESVRGEIASWLLFAFGFAYLVWGIRRAIRDRPHAHEHLHADGEAHDHEHGHAEQHAHAHVAQAGNLTAWVLFLIFVFGPCEPLIPILMYPAAHASWAQALAVALIFSVVTILTMMAVVLGGSFGLSFVRLRRAARFSHAAAGLVVTTAGALMLFAGL